MHEAKIIYRKSMPHKYDHAPQGTLCRVDTDYKTIFYIQKSTNEEQPDWQEVELMTHVINKST